MNPPKLNKFEDIFTDEIEELDNAFVIPREKDLPNAPSQESGVLTAEGEFVSNCINYRVKGQFNYAPELPNSSDLQELSGAWMYAGPMFGHFGHFLMDSMTRFWAWDELKDKIDGILFVPKQNNDGQLRVLGIQTPLIEAMGITAEARVVEYPTRVEKLFVPTMGIGLGEWMMGSPAFQKHVLKYGGGDIEPHGPEKIYISRFDLPKGRSSYVGEGRVQSYLEKAGYTTIHPQKLSKVEQVQRYKAATHVIAPDGSALHLLAYCGRDDQKVSIISRRSNQPGLIFAEQINKFRGSDVVTHNHLVDDWLPHPNRGPNRLSWGQVSLSELSRALLERDMISGVDPLEDLAENEVADEIAAIEKMEEKKFISFKSLNN